MISRRMLYTLADVSKISKKSGNSKSTPKSKQQLFIILTILEMIYMSKNITILKNSFYLILRTIVVSLIGLFTVREVLNLLGVELYGLFNLVFGIAALFAFINGAMVSSTQRYLAYSIGKKDEQKLTEVWQSSLLLHLIVAVLVSVLMLLSKNIIIYDVLTIQTQYLKTANFIFYLSIVSIFISIFQTPFGALILAYEKMSFYAGMSLYDAISKLAIVYSLYQVTGSILEKYAMLYVLSGFTSFLVYGLYCHRKLKRRASLTITNVPLLKELFVYSSWNIFGNFAVVAQTQGVNVLLNIFFGVVVNSSYALTSTITGVIGGLINSVTTAINPQIYKSYAEQDFARNNLLINTGSKYSFFLCLIIIAPFMLHTTQLLSLWLYDIPNYLSDFVKVSLLIVLINCLSGTLMTGVQATGKIKLYQIVVSISVFLNFPISYLLLHYKFQAVSTYWVALVLTFFSLILRLVFLRKLLDFNIRIYFQEVILKVCIVTIASIILISTFEKMLPSKLCITALIGVSFCISVIVLMTILMFGLSIDEKKYLQAKLGQFPKR